MALRIKQSLSLTRDEHCLLKAVAEWNGVTMTNHVRDMIRRDVESIDSPGFKALLAGIRALA